MLQKKTNVTWGAVGFFIAFAGACQDSKNDPISVAPSSPSSGVAPKTTANGATSPEDRARERSGGDTTVYDTTTDAFANAAANLTSDRLDAFNYGHAIFNRVWVMAPSSTIGLDGLGPLFNARSCSGCHGKDGRGKPPNGPDEPMISMLLRLSVPGQDANGGPLGDPIYGTQLRPYAILGVPVEGTPVVRYQEIDGAFEDGESYTLRMPSYAITKPGYGVPSSALLVSPRVGPFVFGLGLLEAVAESTVREGADENDENGDGISGRPNLVWDVTRQSTVLGRFGWKANVPTVAHQTAGAFQGDMGISSAMFPAELCSPTQSACQAAATGGETPGEPEIDEKKLQATISYMQTLAVPARRNVTDPLVRRGEALFAEVGCANCHRDTLQTGILDDFPELSAQTIHPYTDLLLHDLGSELADGRPDYVATGNEWRTAPLWGIGLVKTVNGHTNFLHDGRARSLLEAILWHGGEAAPARDRVLHQAKPDRDALVRFLESLLATDDQIPRLEANAAAGPSGRPGRVSRVSPSY